MNHFKAENIPKSTIYSILSRVQHVSPQRKHGSGTKCQKMTKKKLNTLKKAFDHKDKMSQRQAARKYGISQQMVSKILKKEVE